MESGLVRPPITVSSFRMPARNRTEGAIALLGELVAQDSTEGSAGIRACLDLVEERLAPHLTEVERHEFDGLPARVLRLGAGDPTRRLTFACHVDVVPADRGAWRSDPFALSAHDGRLFGRGTVDMKGGIAACVEAIRLLGAAGRLAGASVELVLTADEEVGSTRGMRPLLAAGGVSGSWAVCCEPTGLRLFLGNRGVVWVDVVITGRGGHAGLAHRLRNPILAASAVVEALRGVRLHARDNRFDPPAPSLTVTGISSDGGARNVVAETARLTIDRRLLPGEDVDAAIAEIGDVVAATLRGSAYSAHVDVARRWPPYAISRDEPISRVAAATLSACGLNIEPAMDSASNDSSWLDRAGIPTILLGPGEPEQAHSSNESVSADDIRAAVEIYTRLICLAA
jgi:acetylornithine deacetylase/succinyl-diaminopimelate desuccinylase-like protein